MPDLNAYDVDAAMNIIEGTARNMGIAIKGVNDAELAEQAKEAQVHEAEMAKKDKELAALEEEAKELASGNVEVPSSQDENKTEE